MVSDEAAARSALDGPLRRRRHRHRAERADAAHRRRGFACHHPAADVGAARHWAATRPRDRRSSTSSRCRRVTPGRRACSRLLPDDHRRTGARRRVRRSPCAAAGGARHGGRRGDGDRHQLRRSPCLAGCLGRQLLGGGVRDLADRRGVGTGGGRSGPADGRRRVPVWARCCWSSSATRCPASPPRRGCCPLRGASSASGCRPVPAEPCCGPPRTSRAPRCGYRC